MTSLKYLNNIVCQLSLLENHENDVSITGVYGYADAKVNSKMSLPKDLSDSEEVRVSYVNENFTDFNDKVLKFVKNDKKVLVIVVSDFSQIFDEVIKAVSQEGNDDVIAYYAWNESSSVTSLSQNNDGLLARGSKVNV